LIYNRLHLRKFLFNVRNQLKLSSCANKIMLGIFSFKINVTI